MPFINQQSIEKSCDDLKELLILKNNAYGNSFEDVITTEGLSNILIRLQDKFNRLRSLANSNVSDFGESIIETVKDISGYGVIFNSYAEEYKKVLKTKYFEEYEKGNFIIKCDECGEPLLEMCCENHGLKSIHTFAERYANDVIRAEFQKLIKPSYQLVKTIDTLKNIEEINKIKELDSKLKKEIEGEDIETKDTINNESDNKIKSKILWIDEYNDYRESTLEFDSTTDIVANLSISKDILNFTDASIGCDLLSIHFRFDYRKYHYKKLLKEFETKVKKGEILDLTGYYI